MTNATAPQQITERHQSREWPSAAGWWERHRLAYNLALGATFVALTVRTWPRLAPELTRAAIPPLVFLAVLANLCYSVAYVVDPLLQATMSPPRRDRRRWMLWFVGTLFAMLLETYWFLDEILPPLLP